MSNYTTQLRYLVESGFDLGLKDYPIFDEAHREELNKKLIEHYYMREIGAETPALFKLFLNRSMAEIMPYYNQLYKSALIEFDPLNGYEMTETETANSSSESTGESSGNGRNLYSDTPQSEITFEDIVNNKYATSATIDETGANTKSNTEGESTRTKTTKGSQYHNPSELLKAYRETFINIDMMVIEDESIANCFMQIY